MPASPTLRPPSSSTPLPQPLPESAGARATLTAEAVEAIESAGERLAGCRDSLRDYLTKRVEPRHQSSYVQRLVTSLDGADEWMWQDRSGSRLREGRTAVLAAALNELAAGDEVGRHFPDPPGGFGNLRSKVRYLVGSTLGASRDQAKAPANPGNPTAASRSRRTPFPEPERSASGSA